jgi:hypothetical protein
VVVETDAGEIVFVHPPGALPRLQRHCRAIPAIGGDGWGAKILATAEAEARRGEDVHMRATSSISTFPDFPRSASRMRARRPVTIYGRIIIAGFGVALRGHCDPSTAAARVLAETRPGRLAP